MTTTGQRGAMLKREMTIINRLGLHARAAAKLVKLCSSFECTIEITKISSQQTVNAKSIMGVMLLSASQGTDVLISAEGEAAEQALDAIETLVNDYFGEGE